MNEWTTEIERESSSVIDSINHHSRHQPGKVAFHCLADDLQVVDELTYAELESKAKAIAATLQELDARGERAILLYPFDLSFLPAFLGCLYAGVVAIPTPPPDPRRLERTLPRLLSIIEDSEATFFLTISPIRAYLDMLDPLIDKLVKCRFIETDNIDTELAESFVPERWDGDRLAYLQYTSGSTSEPKGVMITHENLLVNCRQILRQSGCDETSRGMTWLPYFHDMGLVGGLICPALAGVDSYVMSPMDFLKRPSRWLMAISRYRATHTAAPNFAYEHCLRRFNPKECPDLDLSSMKWMLNAAETVHQETLERFLAGFGPFGLKPDALSPGYGLAEATVGVTVGRPGSASSVRHLSGRDLAQNRVVRTDEADEDVRTVVGCGPSIPDQRIAIVDPDTGKRAGPNRVGEIWVSGPHVAAGYWKRPEETRDVFGAHISDTDEGPFMRTGDLGFVDADELYITGRIKDLIIIAGVNHYPSDIEWTVQGCHPNMRPSGSAVFSVDTDAASEGLAVVAEVEKGTDDLDGIIAEIRNSVAGHHEIDIHAISLIERNTLFKTTSGKVQRRAVRKAFIEGKLAVLKEYVHRERPASEAGPEIDHPHADSSSKTFLDYRDWMRTKIAALIGIGPLEVSPGATFRDLGLSSVEAVSLIGELEEWSGRILDPTLIFQHPTIHAFAKYMACGSEYHREDRVGPATCKRGEAQEPVAIIGLGIRFPNAKNLSQFWELLRSGRDCVREMPPERWHLVSSSGNGPESTAEGVTGRGSFLEDVDRFDCRFFGISSREAIQIDPQQRILLEVAWEALENAGLSPHALAGSRTGVFVGICGSDYGFMQLSEPALHTAYAGTGTALSIAANRLSFFFDFKGPSLSVDTACSSSLTAVHLAANSLKLGEADMALAGAVNLLFSPEWMAVFSDARMLSPGGRCRTFDACADGYVRGEGCGVLVLKRLSDALRDRDTILAVLRGTAINQDGRSNGLTAPNPKAQVEVMREALDRAGIGPERVGYIEAHGTGTPLGDPVEVQALVEVYGAAHVPEKPCILGSVKTNLGHLEAAAGMAGLVKVILSLQHGEIPPHLHLASLNPLIDIESSNLDVATELRPWPEYDGLRVAVVSSFGFGGTNAHAIVEQAPAVPPAGTEENRTLHFLGISAHSREALRDLIEGYVEFLEHQPPETFVDIAYTVNTGRAHFAHRIGLLASSSEEAHKRLTAHLRGRPPKSLAECTPRDVPPQVAFLFTGFGAQYVGMAQELYRTSTIFRDSIKTCDNILQDHLEGSLIHSLYPEHHSDSTLNGDGSAQPALFAVEYSLYVLLQSMGIAPDWVMGHGLGEYVAACVAGVLRLEDALRLVAVRGRLMEALPEAGTMAAVSSGEAVVTASIAPFRETMSIAAVYGPDHCVISGERESMARARELLEAEGMRVTPLNAPRAFHSPSVEQILDPFVEAVDGITFRPPGVPLVSNITGHIVDNGEPMDMTYWRRHMRETIQFARSIDSLEKLGCEVYLEVGPTPRMLAIGRRCLSNGQAGAVWLPSLRQGCNDWESLMRCAAELYIQGLNPDWSRFYGPSPRTRVTLPTYPFQRERCWAFEIDSRSLERKAVQPIPSPNAARNPLLGDRLSLAGEKAVYESMLDRSNAGTLTDHVIGESIVMPAVGYLDMACAAAEDLFGDRARGLKHIQFSDALVIPESGRVCLQTLVGVVESGMAPFRIYSLPESESDASASWRHHVAGHIEVAPVKGERTDSVPNLDELRTRCPTVIRTDELYDRLAARGLHYGPGFRVVEEIRLGRGEALGKVRERVMEGRVHGAHLVSPSLYDGCLQILAAALSSVPETDGKSYLPVAMSSFQAESTRTSDAWCHVSLEPVEENKVNLFTGECVLFDENGDRLAVMEGVTVKRVDLDRLFTAHSRPWEDWFYGVDWERIETAACPNRPGTVDLSDIAEDARRAFPELLERFGVAGYENLLPAIERVSVDYVSATLRELGWTCRVGEEVSFEEMARSLLVQERHWKLFRRVLDMLAEEEVLEEREGGWIVCRDLDNADPTAAVGGLKDTYPECRGEISLLERCGSCLTKIFDGKMDPLEVLFPDGSIDMVASLYRNSPFTKLLNTLCAGAVNIEVSSFSGGRPVRILEIGGGTGGTTETVIEQLPPERIEYTFSDISPLFLAKARERFGSFPFIQYKFFDIEKEPVAQQFQPSAFDIILAANVLHATGDLRRTLSNVRALLAPGGLLILVEGDGKQRFLDLTLGMTEGWWRFSDPPLRTDYPLIPYEKWEDVLKGSGFSESAVLSRGDHEAEVDAKGLKQLVIAARATAEIIVDQRVRPDGGWLIFVDTDGIGLSLAELLRKDGRSSTLVQMGETFDQDTGDGFRINPTSLDDYDRLLASLRDDRVPTARIVHLWSLATPTPASRDGQGLEQMKVRGCGSILLLLQALYRAEGTDLPQLTLVTRGAHHLPGDEQPISVGQTALWGMARTVRLEHGELDCISLDVDPHQSPVDNARIILARVENPSRENQLACRNGETYAMRFARRPLTDRKYPPTAIGPEGTYLITGGMSGLGLLTAQFLVDRGARHLLLLGRHDPVSTNIIDELKEAGAKVLTVKTDVSNAGQIRSALKSCKDSGMPALRGVIHSAGFLSDSLLLNQTWDRFMSVFEPKVDGGWNLHVATCDMPLDFFILYSSLVSLIGNPAQANHAAANAFMDGLAHFRRMSGLPATAVNWGMWSQVGSATSRGLHARADLAGIGPILTADGLEILERLFEETPEQVAVSPINWADFMRQFQAESTRKYFSRFQPETDGAGFSMVRRSDILQRIRNLPTPRKREELKTYLSEQVSTVLGLERSNFIGDDKRLVELGMDSLLALELRTRLEMDLRMPFPATMIFEYPTLEAMSFYIVPRGEEASETPQTGKNEEEDRRKMAEIAKLSVAEAEEAIISELESIVDEDFPNE